MALPLSQLPDTTRLWVYGIDRELDQAEREILIMDLATFVDGWTAHGADLRGGVGLVEGRFAVVAVDETSASASGCSIDAMTRELVDLGRRMGCSLLDSQLVFYRAADGQIAGCDRSTFRARADEGDIGEDTMVFDPTIETLADLRSGAFERPLASSWHRRLVSPAVETP